MEHCAILWDLDGTLLDTLADLTDATNYALGQFGCPGRTVEEIRRFVGNGAKNQIRLSLGERAADLDPEEVLACYKAYYADHCQIKTGPYAGIPEILARLKGEGYPMAVVSNKPDNAVKTLSELHFGGLMEAALGERADVPRKPNPEMVWLTARELGKAPEQCIYVGDSEVDIRTARNAGVRCVSVLWGFRDEDVLAREGIDVLCREVADLPRVIRELEAEIYGK